MTYRAKLRNNVFISRFIITNSSISSLLWSSSCSSPWLSVSLRVWRNRNSNSIISFPETYHLLWCNDSYVANTWLSCSWGLVMVVLHKCDWRKGISWCVQGREIISGKNLSFKLGLLSSLTFTRRSVNNFYHWFQSYKIVSFELQYASNW